MAKNVILFWVFLFVMFGVVVVAASAQAQSSATASSVVATAATTSYATEFTPEQVRDICERNGYRIDLGAAQIIPSNRNQTPAARKAAVDSCCERLQREVDAIKRRVASYESARAALERRVIALERRPQASATASADAVAALKRSVETLAAERDAFVRQAVADLEARLGRVEADNVRQDGEIAALQGRANGVDASVASLTANDAVQDARIESLEADMDAAYDPSFAEFGLHLGIFGIGGWGYEYLSATVGAQLALRLGEQFYWYGATSLLINPETSTAFGAMFHAGVGYDFSQSATAKTVVSLEIGGLLAVTELNNQFEGRHMTAMPTLGLSFRAPEGIRFGFMVHAGPRADIEGNLSGTVGGTLLLGYDFGAR